jgi:hypothetical protein
MKVQRLMLAALCATLALISAAPSDQPPKHSSIETSASATQNGLLGAEFLISPFSLADDQEKPAIAYNTAHDEYMVAWHNQRPFTQDVTVRRVSNMGALLSYFFVSTAPNCVQADLAYNSTNDNYLVVWSQFYDDTTPTNDDRWEIWGRIIDWNAPGSGSPFQIASWANQDLDFPRLAYNVNRNDYMVVWQTSQKPSGSLTGIGRRRISNLGAYLTGPDYLTGSGASNQGAPDIAYNLAGDKYLVTWVELGPALKPNVYLSLMNYLGDVPVGKQLILPELQNYEQQHPAVASNQSNGFMIVFELFAPPDWDVYGREVSIDGTINPTQFLVSIMQLIDEKNPAIASGSGAHDYFTLLEQSSPSGTGLKLMHWGIDVNYQVQEIEAGFGDYTFPALARGSPGILAAYEWVSNSPTDDKDVYGRLYWPYVSFLPLVLR